MKETMRRGERQVTDPEEIRRVLDECGVCRLGLWDGKEVYVVPVNFGYEQTEDGYILYFHTAQEGRKVDLLRRGGTVGFEMDCAHRLVGDDALACKFTMKYESIIGTGRARELPEEERPAALRKLMAHYTDNGELGFAPAMVARISLFALDVEELRCKANR